MLMLKPNIDRQEFGRKLNEIVSPAQPIQSIEHLFGRHKELDRIEKALFAPGRHIFVYGHRGVGKSSLAATAANQFQSADAKYIDVAGAPDATLRSVVANIGYQATRASRLNKTKRSTTAALDLKYLKFDAAKEVTPNDLHAEIHSLPDAVEILREASLIHSAQPIVVVDEFDRIKDDAERGLFADLLKHLGDKKVGLKFMFTGVARTLEELLGAHQSAIRQLETIELPKLSWDARWDIVLAAARAFSLGIDKEIYIRIAAVSDGYPYYVHLITEKLLWQVYEDQQPVEQITWGHYHRALRDAIDSINAELRRPYEMAVNQRSDDYEEVLWSTADSEYLMRYLRDMYSSYEYVMKQRTERGVLQYDKYCSRIRSLRGKACGEILIADQTKPGLYSYKEKMLRGYVRMQAETHGIELIGEQTSKTVRPKTHVPASASRGYYGPSIPKGVHIGRKRGQK